MSGVSRQTRLATRLTRRMLLIAVAVLVANTLFVAYDDASDRDYLLSGALIREIANLDAAVGAARSVPPVIRDDVRSLYAEYPAAYGYAVVDAAGRIVDAMNPELFPPTVLDRPITLHDWFVRSPDPDKTEAMASHVVVRDEGLYRVFFAIHDDPENLIREEIWGEFLGHVWLPLFPTVVLLIGGMLLVIRRDLAPVAAAAAWARGLRPGAPAAPFHDARAPSEIADLTHAVSRAVERLNTELDREKHRAAEAAHALRTPIAVIVAQLDGLPDDPAVRRLRDDIKALSRTVTQLLLAVGADRLDIDEDSTVDLNGVAEETVARLTPLAMLNGAAVRFSAAPGPVMVSGVDHAIDLALTNLIENAILHGQGDIVEVTVAADHRITVRDRGPGLPADHGARMFEPFWQGNTQGTGGTGLGLAIVARIQRAHGGGVDTANHPGGGAVFTLWYRPASTH